MSKPPCLKCGSCAWVVRSSGGCDSCASNFSWLAFAVVVVLTGLLVALLVAYGEWAYGDWTCAFKECRVIK